MRGWVIKIELSVQFSRADIIKLFKLKLVVLAIGFTQLNECREITGLKVFAKIPPVSRHQIHSSV